MSLKLKSSLGLGSSSGLGLGVGHGHAYAATAAAAFGTVIMVAAGVLIVAGLVRLARRKRTEAKS